MTWNRAFEAGTAIVRRSTWRFPNEPQRIYLDVGSRIDTRTLRELLILFQMGNLNVSVRASLSRRTLSTANILEWHPNADLIWRSAGAVQPHIVCTDRCIDNRCLPDVEKIIHLQYDYRPNMHLGLGEFAMPFPMHPQIYVQYHAHERLAVYRQSERRIRLLFAGNWNSDGYNKAIMGELFDKLTRFQIVDYIRKNQLATVVETSEQLDAVLAREFSNEFVLVDSTLLRIDQANWLSLLSKADFFLCPPGILFPWSHNVVEAMGVGTIPLINYPDWFYPQLADRINSMTFSTTQELCAGIMGILSMDRSRIEGMRQNVIAYYDEHLAPARFVSRLLGSPERIVCLHLWAEKEDVLRQGFERPRSLVPAGVSPS